MSSPIRFDLWQKKRPLVETKLNRQSITLEAFEAECGFQLPGVAQVPDAYVGYLANVDTGTLTEKECTLEFLYKLNSLATSTDRSIVYLTDASVSILELRYHGASNQFKIIIRDNVPTSVTLNTGIPCTTDVWHHYAITREYSGGTTTINFYVDGLLVYTGSTGLLNGNNFVPQYFVYVQDRTGASVYLPGYITNLRLWNTVISPEDIYHNQYRRLAYVSTYNGNLILSYWFEYADGTINWANHGADADSSLGPVIGATSYSVNNNLPDYVGFGSSFIVGQWDVTLSAKTSLVFPITPPDDTTVMLVVRWVDEDGESQRRRLWDLEGVIIDYERITPYNGERLPLEFTLEAWNIDGEAMAELPEELVVLTGLTSLPTTDVDHASQEAYDPTLDITLAATFPWTFPVTFNEAFNFLD